MKFTKFRRSNQSSFITMPTSIRFIFTFQVHLRTIALILSYYSRLALYRFLSAPFSCILTTTWTQVGCTSPLQVPEETGRLLGDFYQDIPTMAISMDEVVLHQHLEKSSRAETSYHRIERMHILLKIRKWHSFHKTFHKNRVSGLLLERHREIDVFIVDEMPVESDFSSCFGGRGKEVGQVSVGTNRNSLFAQIRSQGKGQSWRKVAPSTFHGKNVSLVGKSGPARKTPRSVPIHNQQTSKQLLELTSYIHQSDERQRIRNKRVKKLQLNLMTLLGQMEAFNTNLLTDLNEPQKMKQYPQIANKNLSKIQEYRQSLIDKTK